MPRPDRIHWGGMTAMLGGALGILYSPLYALAYFATAGGASSLEAPWEAVWAGAARLVLEPLLTFASPHTVYLTYDKCFSFMILGWRVCLPSTTGRPRARAGWRDGAFVSSLPAS